MLALAKDLTLASGGACVPDSQWADRSSLATNISSYSQVSRPEDLIEPFSDPRTNMTHCVRPASSYSGILESVPKDSHLAFLYLSPEQQAIFGGKSESRNGKSDPEIIIGQLLAYFEQRPFISSELRTLLIEDVKAQMELLSIITNDDRMSLSLQLKDPKLIFGNFNKAKPEYLSKYHVDEVTSLNLTWTPASHYLSATEMQENANVIRERMKSGQDDGYELGEFLRDPQAVFKLPINHLALMAGEISSKANCGFEFNIGNGCVHRGTPVEPEKRRLQIAITTLAVPQNMQSRVNFLK